jgi:Sec-independent protein translocase protein TatA
VTSWVVLLLVVFLILGTSRMAPAKATRLALVITSMVVLYEVVKMGKA